MSSDGQPRVRRTSDVFTAVFGLLLIVWVVVGIDSVAAWEQALIDLAQSGPQWVTSLFRFGYALGLLYVLGLLAALIAGGKERRPALRDLVIVAVGSAGLVVLLSLTISDVWPYVLPEIGLENPVPRFPDLRVALVTAVLIVVGPHVTRPLRRFGWFVIAATAIASVGLNYGTPSYTIGSFGVGLLAAGLLLIIEGSPRGYPDPEVVAAALARLGAPVQSLELAPYQTWGVIRFVGSDDEGKKVDIKVRGRDAYDSQLVAKLWHTLWYRETSRTVSYSRLGAVEHEALITGMAERAGLRVPQVTAVGSASSEVSLISFQGTGVPLPESAPADISDDFLIETWRQVRLLHERSMSHGSLNASAVHVGSGRVRDHRFRPRLSRCRDGRPGQRCRRAPLLAVLARRGGEGGQHCASGAGARSAGCCPSLSPGAGRELGHQAPGGQAQEGDLRPQLRGRRAGRCRSARAREAAASDPGRPGHRGPDHPGRVGARPTFHQRGLRRDMGDPPIGELGSPRPRLPRGARTVHRPGDGHDVRGTDDIALLAVADLADREPVHQPGRAERGGQSCHEHGIPPQVRRFGDRSRRSRGDRRVFGVPHPSGDHGPCDRRGGCRPESRHRHLRGAMAGSFSE